MASKPSRVAPITSYGETDFQKSPDSIPSPQLNDDDVGVLDLDDDEFDARTMSPRRDSEEVEKVASEAKEILEQQAKLLQESLVALLDRVDKVKEEHDKLEGENKFLQDYIGHLMQTSKITGSGARSSTGAKGR